MGRGASGDGSLLAAAFFTAMGFLAGSLPFSLWVGRIAAGRDIRRVGDGNPGAINVARAGGWRPGLAAGVLDFAKGALPVVAAHDLAGLGGWALLPVAAAPLLGHAFSPFLGGRGGKALATTFGIWTGLLFYEGTAALGCCFGFFYLLLAPDAWAAVLGLAAFGGYLVWRGAPPSFMAVWGVDLAVVAFKHLPWLRGGIRLRLAGGGGGE